MSSFEELNQFLYEQSVQQSSNNYKALAREAAGALASIGAQVDSAISDIYKSLLRDACADCYQISNPLENRVKEEENQALTRLDCMDTIEQCWGDEKKDTMLVDVDEDSPSLPLLAKIATRYSHHKAKRRLRRAIFKRMINADGLESLSPAFTQSDLLAVLENPDLGEEPLSQEEVNKIECQNNWAGLLKLKNDVEDSDGKQE